MVRFLLGERHLLTWPGPIVHAAHPEHDTGLLFTSTDVVTGMRFNVAKRSSRLQKSIAAAKQFTHRPTTTNARYLKIALLRNGGQEGKDAARILQRVCRRRGPDVWQFRWSETDPDGKRAHRKKVVGTVDQYADEHSARRAVVGLIAEINRDFRLPNSRTITVAELCDHFEQRELADQNNWRSHATKKIYKAYLNRWVRLIGRDIRCPRSGQSMSSPGFVLCRWRKAVAPKSAI
jgi:hypothetical protein